MDDGASARANAVKRKVKRPKSGRSAPEFSQLEKTKLRGLDAKQGNVKGNVLTACRPALQVSLPSFLTYQPGTSYREVPRLSSIDFLYTMRVIDRPGQTVVRYT